MSKEDRRKREYESRVSKILEAAREKFEIKEYEAVTMEEIAESAEFAKGTVYYYFSSKSAVLFEIIKNDFKELIYVLDSASKSCDDTFDKLKAIIISYSKYQSLNCSKIVLLWKSFNSGQSVFGETEIKELKKYHRVFINIVEDVISNGIKEGRVKSINPTYAAAIIGGLIMGMPGVGQGYINNFSWDGYYQTVIDTVISGLKSEEEG
jgi:AcrR family transcriptional regulator